MKRQRRHKRVIYTSCSAAEKREWKRLADEEGLSLAGLIRSQLMRFREAVEDAKRGDSEQKIRKPRMCANEKLFFKPYEKQLRSKQ